MASRSAARRRSSVIAVAPVPFFTGAGLSTKKSACLCASVDALDGYVKITGVHSMPMKAFPRLTQATPVVPDPMKGSRMVSAFGRKPKHHSISATGFCVGWTRPSRFAASPLAHCVNFFTDAPLMFVHG